MDLTWYGPLERFPFLKEAVLQYVPFLFQLGLDLVTQLGFCAVAVT